VAPFSSIHEDETNLWQGRTGKTKEDLMEFIKTTSRGHKFKRRHNIEQTQIFRAFQAFASGNGSPSDIEAKDAIAGDINEWDDYLRIDVVRSLGDIELMRDLKQQSVDILVGDVFPKWRSSSSTFEQDVSEEIQAAAKGYLDSYFQHFSRLVSGDLNTLFDSPEISMVVESLMHSLPPALPIERLGQITSFFKSSHFADVPFVQLSVRIYATLKAMVKRGAFTAKDSSERLRGFFNDVKHVSVYAPYCDAFVMDQAMAALVSDPHVGLETRYGVKVFSLNNWDQFLAWLDGLEAGMTPEHRAGLAVAYP